MYSMKRVLAILVALVCSLSVLCVTALADDDVTIPSGKTAKAGTTLTKDDATANPVLDIYEITPGTTIKFWIYRNGHAQVSPTYILTVGADQDIAYNNSGNMVKNEKYHSVWKKTTQSTNESVYIHFAFIP